MEDQSVILPLLPKNMARKDGSRCPGSCADEAFNGFPFRGWAVMTSARPLDCLLAGLLARRWARVRSQGPDTHRTLRRDYPASSGEWAGDNALGVTTFNGMSNKEPSMKRVALDISSAL